MGQVRSHKGTSAGMASWELWSELPVNMAA